jgi:hypothetical protein
MPRSKNDRKFQSESGKHFSRGATVHTVVVTIDEHETVLTFESKEEAEA